MIVDSSALVAVVLGEDDAELYAQALAGTTESVTVSAATLVEASLVVASRQGPDASRDLQLLLSDVSAVFLPFDEEQAGAAVAAWSRFGKGRHPAGLNLGDCYSYAAAAVTGEALLFKGDDFPQTDISSVI